MYKVIYPFKDLEDKDKHIYHIGDKFPYDDRKISKKRLEELTSKNNKIGEVLIVLEDDLTDDKPENNDSLSSGLQKDK